MAKWATIADEHVVTWTRRMEWMKNIRPLQGREDKKRESGFGVPVYPGFHPGLPAFLTTEVVTNASTPLGSWQGFAAR